MKKIDFSYSGGIPFDQDKLDYLQTAYKEIVALLATACVNVVAGQLVVLSGMVVTVVGSDVTVTDGSFIYNGEIYKFTGSTVTLGGGDVALVNIVRATTNLTYNDGGVHPAIIEETGVLINAPTVTDASNFPVGDMVPFVVIDPALYGDIATLNAEVASLITEVDGILDVWVADTATVGLVAAAGGGAVTGITVNSSEFKRNGHTFYWQAQITFTVAGTVTSILFRTPNNFYAGGGSWKLLNHIQPGVLNSATVVGGLQVKQFDSGAGPSILLAPYVGNFTPGVNVVYVNIVAETT